MFGKKNETSPVAVIESESPVAQPEPVPAPAPATVRVVVLRPLHEGGRNYSVEQEFSTTPPRAQELARLGLVTIIDPNVPRVPPPPKIRAAREQAHQADAEASARFKEQGEVQEEVKRAEAKVAALRGALSVAEGLDDVRRSQDALAEAERDLEAKRQLLANVAQRARESDTRAQAARKVLKDLEGRAAWLIREAIPRQQENLEVNRRTYEAKLRDAQGCLDMAVRPAEEALSKLQAELAALGD